jgi:hypothetical protein
VIGAFANAPLDGGRFQSADGRGSFAIDYTANSVVLSQFAANPPPGQGRIDREPGGRYVLTFTGTPSQTYTIQFTPTLAPPNWQTLATAIADAQGIYTFVDTPPAGTTQRFYRSVFP